MKTALSLSALVLSALPTIALAHHETVLQSTVLGAPDIIVFGLAAAALIVFGGSVARRVVSKRIVKRPSEAPKNKS